MKYLKIIVLILLAQLVCSCSLIKTDNSKLLEKYTFELPDEYKEKVDKIKTKIVKIKHNKEDNLLTLETIKFKNMENDNTITLYKKLTPTMSMYMLKSGSGYILINHDPESYDDEINQIKKDFKENYSEIDIEDVFKRNNVKYDIDLVYNAIKYRDKKVDKTSSKNEIIDKFVFDYTFPIVVPADDKVIFFTGDYYGYVNTWDKRFAIQSLNKDKIISVVYEDNSSETLNIPEDDILHFVSTIEYIN